MGFGNSVPSSFLLEAAVGGERTVDRGLGDLRLVPAQLQTS